MARTSSKKAASIVLALARYFIKKNGHVVYLVLASNGKDTYCTTIINGKATGCTCPSYKPCKHMKQMEAKEQEREQAPKPAAPAYNVVTEAENVAAEADRLHNIEEVVEYASSLMQQIERDSADDAYAVLATSKNVDMPSCHYCGRPGYKVCPRCM